LQPAIAWIQGTIRQVANGDPEPYKACWSQAADVTIYGGWGAYERGWSQVEPRLKWAVARWRGGHTNFDLLALGTSGALAYTIWTEHGSARLAGIDEYRSILLRITHLYRQEGVASKNVNAFLPSEVVGNAVGAIYRRFTLRRFPYES
jgi:hypothetical protein